MYIRMRECIYCFVILIRLEESLSVYPIACLMVVGIFASMFDAGLRWCLAMRTHVLADGPLDGRMDGKRNGQTDVRIICINYFLFTIFLVCWLFSSYILFFFLSLSLFGFDRGEVIERLNNDFGIFPFSCLLLLTF